ncbi:hypothetical protein [Flavobacterium sp.]|uniref:HYC_CC_PP family protein n=1 Tax=Flavobacterium sp. TaxID=239 RepID=UPI0026205813|nr:hypothetical protein [Flavobacterium sp.]
MQFKKQLCLFLAFFVLVSNVGFALNVHYCDDQIASVSFNTSSPSNIEEDCCGVVEKPSHCCKDKVVLIQKKSDQAIVKSFSFEWQDMVFPNSWIFVFATNVILSQKNTVAAYYCDSHAPPLFKLYSQYVFYDQV